MATLNDNILLSLDVYDPSSTVKGWTRIATDSDDTSGFFAAAYQKGNEIVIAFRGWDNFDPRDIASIERAYDNKPYEQIKDAQNFVDEILGDHPGANVSLTGNSLGGSLAAIMAVRNDLTAETFGAIESVDAAFKSMNGFEFDASGVTLWEIPEADHNQDITRAELRSFANVTNHLVFGEIASYNDRTVPFANQIGVDQLYAKVIRTGILEDDSRFGDYRNSVGDAFEAVGVADVANAPYTEAFSTAIHALGFHGLAIVFENELTPLWTSLPRLAFQLTNDFLATERDGDGSFRATYDLLDSLMFDHLSSSGGATVATAMIDDLTELAASGGQSSALSNADINTALLQITIQYASTQTLDNAISNFAGGIITDGGDFIAADLKGPPNWHPDIDPKGYQLITEFADFLLGDAAGLLANAAERTRHLLVEANNGAAATIESVSGTLDLVFGGSSGDVIRSRAGGDTVFGRAGSDVIAGGDGADVLAGEAGADRMMGSTGGDILIGGAGRDTLSGGAGADSFVFTSLNNGAGGDRINGFDPDADRFVIDNDVFTEVGNEGPLADNAFFEGAAANDASDRIVYNSATGALFYDADGTGAEQAVRIATLATGLALSEDDFRII